MREEVTRPRQEIQTHPLNRTAHSRSQGPQKGRVSTPAGPPLHPAGTPQVWWVAAADLEVREQVSNQQTFSPPAHHPPFVLLKVGILKEGKSLLVLFLGL